VYPAIDVANPPVDWVPPRFRPSIQGANLSVTPPGSGWRDERRISMTSATLSEAEDRFRADPGTARGTPTVTATLANGRARLSAGAFNWDADLPTVIGGTNLAPSPTAYLLGALAGCGVAFLNDTLAPQFGVQIDGITATARCSTDLRGLLGTDDASPELMDIELDIEVISPDPEEKTGPMFDAWRDRCPIYLSLLRPRPVSLTTRIA
jgi:uncharacterized OsmC-like protein